MLFLMSFAKVGEFKLVASLCKNLMWHFLQTLLMSCMYSLTDSEHVCISYNFPCNMMHSYVLNLDVFSGVLYIYV